MADCLASGSYGSIFKILSDKYVVKLIKNTDFDSSVREIYFCNLMKNTNGIIQIKTTESQFDSDYNCFISYKKYMCDLNMFIKCIHDIEFINQFQINRSRVIDDITYELLFTLMKIHSNGVIHADLKPENILINFDIETQKVDLVICDFGMSIYTENDYEDLLIQTKSFRAPEILGFRSLVRFKNDVWSMGCILYELFLGRPLFDYNKCKKDPTKHISKFFECYVPDFKSRVNNLNHLINNVVEHYLDLNGVDRLTSIQRILLYKSLIPNLKYRYDSVQLMKLLTDQDFNMYKFMRIPSDFEIIAELPIFKSGLNMINSTYEEFHSKIIINKKPDFKIFNAIYIADQIFQKYSEKQTMNKSFNIRQVIYSCLVIAGYLVGIKTNIHSRQKNVIDVLNVLQQ